MHIDQALDRFLIQLEADGRSVATRRQYARHVRLLARWARTVGHTGVVGDISPEDIARFLVADLAKCGPEGRAKRASSMNALRGSLSGFFAYLHRAGHIAEDPTRLLRRASTGSAPPETLSEAEQDRLLFALANGDGPAARRDSAMIHLMLRSGLRVGSVVALDADDVDLERAELRVRTTKGDRPERVLLARAVRDHLRRYLGGRRAGPLFPGRGEKRLTTRHVDRRLRYWLGVAGIEREVSPHVLRHSFATGLYQRTGDVLLVKEALRHRSIASTMVYVRPDEARLRSAIG